MHRYQDSFWRRRLMATSAVTGLLLAPIGAAMAAAPPASSTTVPSGRAAVSDARPVWATASADRGTTNQGRDLNVRVYLAGRDPQGLADFARSVSDPHSADFRHYLKPARYWLRFGPSSAQVRTVRSWLTAAGLKVTGANQHYISVHGSAASAERAFGVTIHDFAAQGGSRYAPAGRVSVPAGVGSAVLGVVGLDNGSAKARPAGVQPGPTPVSGLPGPAPVTLRATPCSTYFGQNAATGTPPAYGHVGTWTQCGDTPQQVRSLYGADKSGLTGAGVKVAIMDAYASPTIASDVTTYTKAHGTHDFRNGQFTQSLPAGFSNVAACGGNFWYTEESLDIDAVHNMAPDANVVYVGSASCQDVDLTDALSRIVDNHLADIVANSWTDGPADGETVAQRSAYDQVFQQAAAEGIGIYFSSGDCGAEDPATACGSGSTRTEPDFPPEDPWVTAVGATSLAVGANGKELFQSGWGELLSTPISDGSGWTPAPPAGYPSTYDAGSGGGTSYNVAQPQYQQGVVPDSLATTLMNGTTSATPMRVVPDVAADGDNNTGMLVGQTQTFLDGATRYHETRWGGTSLSSPLFAGVQALAQQAQGSPIGFANPQIYGRHGSRAIEDVTDTPLGAGVLFGVVRNNYANPQDPDSAVTTRLDTFAHDGLLHATAGYDDVTGVGAPSPTGYLDSYRS